MWSLRVVPQLRTSKRLMGTCFLGPRDDSRGCRAAPPGDMAPAQLGPLSQVGASGTPAASIRDHLYK